MNCRPVIGILATALILAAPLARADEGISTAREVTAEARAPGQRRD